MKSLTPAAILAVALLAGGAASASTIGLPGTTSVYTTWDTFPSASFAGDAADTDSTTFTSSLSFSTSPASAILTGGGQRLYTNENASLFTVAGTSTVAITDLQITLKFTAPGTGTAADFFTVALGGVGSGTLGYLGSSVEGANTFQIYEWTWSNLNIAAGQNFSITAAGLPDHVSIDAVQVGSVPEASTSILGALAAGAMLVRRRR